MSHYAELNEDLIVVRVLVGDPLLSDDEGLEAIKSIFGGNWLRTSYNNKIRGNFAGIGYSYFAKEDLFMPSKCHEEAILDEVLAKWLCKNPDHDIKPLA
jgi:hypothetical protein